MNKITTGVIIGLILVTLGIFLLSRNGSGAPIAVPQDSYSNIPESNSTSTAQNSSPDIGAPKAGEYTLADVSKHSNASSCWTTINGGVYDVTAWINQHPGGPEAILSLCGKDGSAAFDAQHGGQRRPASELATFKIGVLVN
ncbi:MAG: cytochrome b5-like heme/steroid binding domain-containing protein [Patescibacteria group bacterium]